MKEPKEELVKARVTRRMKNAVAAAAASRTGDNNDESDVVRDALHEYLIDRGYMIAEDDPEYRIAAKRQQQADPLTKAGRHAAEVQRAAKRSATHQRKKSA